MSMSMKDIRNMKPMCADWEDFTALCDRYGCKLPAYVVPTETYAQTLACDLHGENFALRDLFVKLGAPWRALYRETVARRVIFDAAAEWLNVPSDPDAPAHARPTVGHTGDHRGLRALIAYLDHCAPGGPMGLGHLKGEGRSERILPLGNRNRQGSGAAWDAALVSVAHQDEWPIPTVRPANVGVFDTTIALDTLGGVTYVTIPLRTEEECRMFRPPVTFPISFLRVFVAGVVVQLWENLTLDQVKSEGKGADGNQILYAPGTGMQSKIGIMVDPTDLPDWTHWLATIDAKIKSEEHARAALDAPGYVADKW